MGVDIATLLLRNKDAYPYDSKSRSQDVGRRESLISQRSGATGGDGSTQDISILSDKSETKQRKTIEQVTDEFRNTLLYGLVQEALGMKLLSFFLRIHGCNPRTLTNLSSFPRQSMR